MKRIILLPLFCLSLYAEQYNIDTLIEKAIISSPDLNISKSNYQISQERSHQADADYLPQVDLYGGAGVIGVKSNIANSDGKLISGKITASQLIYDFGKTGGNMDIYSEESNASHAIFQQNLSNKVYAVKRDYYDLSRKALLIKVYEENVKLTQQQLTRAKRYFEAGIKTKIDVSDAHVRHIEAKIELENAKYDLRLAYVTLSKTIGNMDDSLVDHVYIQDIKATVGLYDMLPKEQMNGKQLVQFAFMHRYDLKSYQHKIKSAESKVRKERGDYFPGIYVGGDYQYNSVDEDLQLYVPERQWNANINVKWNLFGGLRTQAKSEEAKLALLQQHASYNDAKLKIVEETSNAFIKLLKTDSNVELSEELVAAAKEKFQQAQQRYEHGLSDYIELQEARLGYINSTAELVVNFYEYYISLAALDRAIGR